MAGLLITAVWRTRSKPSVHASALLINSIPRPLYASGTAAGSTLAYSVPISATLSRKTFQFSHHNRSQTQTLTLRTLIIAARFSTFLPARQHTHLRIL